MPSVIRHLVSSCYRRDTVRNFQQPETDDRKAVCDTPNPVIGKECIE